MRLQDYERNRNPRGMHGWGNLYRPYDDALIEEIAALKLGWFKILDDGGGHVMHVCEKLRAAGIMPIVRLYRPQPYPGTLPQSHLDTVARYVREGITRWFEPGNEPNLDAEWKDPYRGHVQYGNPELVMPDWLADAEAIIERGGYPAYPALAPCGRQGRQASITTHERYFQWLAENAYERARQVFENGAWIASHPYVLNHFYKSGQPNKPSKPRSASSASSADLASSASSADQWHFEYPDDPICQAARPGTTVFDDDCGLLNFRVPIALLRRYFGLTVPVVGTEGGLFVPRPGHVIRQDDRYPGYDLEGHAEATVAMFDWIARHAPPYFFGLCLWLLDDYYPQGRAIPAVRALRATEPRLRPDIMEEEMKTPIRILKEDGQVDVMELEEYLRGVVPAEVPALWPAEALKAQAVAARTYALYAIEHGGRHPNADLCTTTHCQAYDPDKIHPATDAAVAETAGLVAHYRGETINALFCASCGGHTLNNEDVFSGEAVPYLRGVPCPCNHDRQGHGVGLCQQGAKAMAEAGASFENIIKHYYSGVDLAATLEERIEQLRARLQAAEGEIKRLRGAIAEAVDRLEELSAWLTRKS